MPTGRPAQDRRADAGPGRRAGLKDQFSKVTCSNKTSAFENCFSSLAETSALAPTCTADSVARETLTLQRRATGPNINISLSLSLTFSLFLSLALTLSLSLSRALARKVGAFPPPRDPVRRVETPPRKNWLLTLYSSKLKLEEAHSRLNLKYWGVLWENPRTPDYHLHLPRNGGEEPCIRQGGLRVPPQPLQTCTMHKCTALHWPTTTGERLFPVARGGYGCPPSRLKPAKSSRSPPLHALYCTTALAPNDISISPL